MSEGMETRVVEAPWTTYVRIVRYVPDGDHLDFSERAPRVRAASGLAEYTVPAADLTMIAELDSRDYHQERVQYFAWMQDDWYAMADAADALDVLDPAGAERRAAKRAVAAARDAAAREAHEYRERVWTTDQHGTPAGTVGLHRNPWGNVIYVVKATPRRIRYRHARPEEIAAYEAAESLSPAA